MDELAQRAARYWIEAVFGAVLAVLSWGYKRLDKRVKRQDAVGLGVQALLRDRIIQAYNHYLDKGFCPIYGRENVEAMYSQYHALGGNGTITELMDDLRALPTRPEKEAKKNEGKNCKTN